MATSSHASSLAARRGHSECNSATLRGMLRGRATEQELGNQVAAIWTRRDDRYSELRSQQTARKQTVNQKVEMSHIGG